MKNILRILTVLLCVSYFGYLSYANEVITDVKENDPAYSYVSKAVNSGYLTLYNGGKFYPEQSVTRKEMALFLDKFALNFEQKSQNLSKADFQELFTLSKNFKEYLVDYDLNKTNTKDGLLKVENEQKGLNADLSKAEDEITELKVEVEKQRFYMIVGGVIITAIALIGR